MRFSLTDEQQEFRDGFRRFLDDRVVPRAAQVDRDGVFPADNYEDLAEYGYNGIGHPEEFGGTVLDPISTVIAQEELARACASTFLSVGASVGLFGVPLRSFACRASSRAPPSARGPSPSRTAAPTPRP